MRTLAAGELARILGGTGQWLFRVETKRRVDAAWTNLSAVAGGDWALSVSTSDGTPDQPTGQFTLAFVRRADGRTLSPGITAEAFNTTAALLFAPLLYPGGLIRVDAANIVRGAGAGTAVWRRWLEGEVEDVDWPADAVEIQCSTLDGVIEAAWLEEESVGGGVTMEAEIQALLTMAAPGETLTVRTISSQDVGEYRREKGSIGELARNLAQRIGYDLRYRWDDVAGAFRYTFMQPDRGTPTPVTTLTPGQIFEVPALKASRQYVRNVFRVTFSDDAQAGRRNSLFRENTASIAAYGRRFAEFIEGDDSNIRNLIQADALLDFAEHDLAEPLVAKRVRIPFCPWFEVHDALDVAPDGARFDFTGTFGVVGAAHEITAAGASTVLDLSGRGVVGQYLAWLRRFGVYNPADAYYSVTNVREDETQSTLTELAIVWDQGAGVEEVWKSFAVVARETDEAWSAIADATAFHGADSTTPVMITRPGEGVVVLLQLEPRYYDSATGALLAGPVSRSAWGAGAVREGTVEAAGIEIGTTATLWYRLVLAGIAATLVEIYTRIGRGGARLGPYLPTRVEGDASTVYGGAPLGPLEYEWDGAIPTSGFLIVDIDVTWATGRTRTEVVMPFDRGMAPNFLADPKVTGLEVELLADSDTKSLRLVGPVGSGYDVTDSGNYKRWTVPVPAATAWYLSAYAYSVPETWQGVALASQYDVRPVYVNNGAGAPAASWDEVGTYAEPPVGTDALQITLLATAAPVGYTAVVRESHNAGYGWVGPTDITASLSPARSAPPTSGTTYIWHSGYVLRPESEFARLVEFWFEAEIKDGLGNTVEIFEFGTSHYTTP